MSEFEPRNTTPASPLTPSSLATEIEARKHTCPYYAPLMQQGQIHFITCRASDCMAWRWARHFKIENREPRPLGYCGRVEAPALTLEVEGLPVVLAASETSVASVSLIKQ